MLLLTRRIKESIVIGKDREILIKVLGIHGNQVRLGILADKSVPIFRTELLEEFNEFKETRSK